MTTLFPNHRNAVAALMVACGAILALASFVQADDPEAWPEPVGGKQVYKQCVQQAGNCFSDPYCSSCSNGQPGWRTCGTTVFLGCKEIQARSYGKCNGADIETYIICYDEFTCSRIAIYGDVNCVNEVGSCRWWVVRYDACDPFAI
jgi:hypothetical protein